MAEHSQHSAHGASDHGADHGGGHSGGGPHGPHGEIPQEAHAEVANPTALLVTFLSLTFGTIFVVLVLAVYHNTYKTNLIATSQEGWTRDADTTFITRRGTLDRLNSYGTVNAENGVYHIPIDAAAALVVAEYATMGARGAADGVGDTVVASGAITEESTETAGGNGS